MLRVAVRMVRAFPLVIISCLAIGPGCTDVAQDSTQNLTSGDLKGACEPATDDNNPCTIEGCKGSDGEHVPATGEFCGAGALLMCDNNGFCAGCATDSQCGEGTECAPLACKGGVCIPQNTPAGMMVSEQVAGDCKVVQCDGKGGTAEAPEPKGTDCNINGGKKCDGDGSCVVCFEDAHCNGEGASCQGNTCISCDDGMQNGDEDGVDCGGTRCSKKCNGDACSTGSECHSGFCADKVCCESACTGECMSCSIMGAVGQCTETPFYDEDLSYVDPVTMNERSCMKDELVACNGAGKCLAMVKAPCSQTQRCLSDVCVDLAGNNDYCKGATGEPCQGDPTICASGECEAGLCK